MVEWQRLLMAFFPVGMTVVSISSAFHVRSFIQALLAGNLERQKAVYASSARTHERRIDVIMNLNRRLIEAARCFQVMTSGRQEAGPHFDEAIKMADGVLVQGLLLVPKPLR